MKAIVCMRQGTPVSENIEFRHDWPDPPEPGPGEVRLRTLASAFNHMDLWIGRGLPGHELDYPRVSGCDACGEVVGVGAGVDESWVGRRVIFNAAVPQPEPQRPGDPPGSTRAPQYQLIGEQRSPGAHAELINVPVENVAPVGDAEPVHAAAFGLTMLTAYSMMVTKAGLHAGQSVLVTGIGGGVATSALAIARHFSCPVCVTSRHEWKLERARQLGADHAVLDEGQDWSRDVRAWTSKRGVDLAVDTSGKATHLNALKSLTRGGAYVTAGCTSGPDATTDLARIFWLQLRLLGSTMGTNDEFREVVSLFRAGALGPVVDQVFPAEACVDAYRRLEAGDQFGKIAVEWG